jgi:Uma2 family endonuclease
MRLHSWIEGEDVSTATIKNLLTTEEFARLPEPDDGSKQELVRGEVVTMPVPGFLHGLVVGNVAFSLNSYVRKAKLGHVVISSGVITEKDPDSVRGPDVSFWTYKRLPFDHEPFYYASIAADLYVEVTSHVPRSDKMTCKVREYFASGALMVWVVDPEARTVTIYRKPGDGRVFWEDATITGEDVVPGFTCPVAEFFQLDQ